MWLSFPAAGPLSETQLLILWGRETNLMLCAHHLAPDQMAVKEADLQQTHTIRTDANGGEGAGHCKKGEAQHYL